jgi:hypothetical protein
MTVTKLERMDVDANNVYINGFVSSFGGGGGGGGGGSGGSSNSSVLDDYAAKLYRDGNEIIIPAVEAHADALLLLAESELDLANLLLNESGGAVTEINVTVEGSVITEGDLAATITNMQYEMQRRGQNVLIDSISI